jgi:general secretion pathway protein J
MQHNKIIKSKGFTLIEMIIAISIFAIIAVAGYSSLTNFIKSSKAIEKSMENLEELQLFLTFVERDFSQVFSQEIYLEKDELKITSIQDNQLIDIHYTLKDDSIIRSQDGVRLVLLKNISKLKVRVLNNENTWQTLWKKSNNAHITVTEWTFDSPFGEIKKLVMIDGKSK